MPFCCDTFSNSGAYACSADLNDPNRNAVIDRQLDESCVKYGVTITRPSPPPASAAGDPSLPSPATAAIPPLRRAPPGMGLSLAASLALWEALQRCWHPSVHVPRIADKFLRLSLQLVAR